jgi:hypothetical protein
MLNYAKKIAGFSLSLGLEYVGVVKSKFLRSMMEPKELQNALIVIGHLWSRNNVVSRDIFICGIWTFYW